MLKKVLLNILMFAFIITFSFFSCKKDESKPEIETGTVTDIDGNIYKTVKIGDQWWMSENLKVTKYRNGKSINKISNYDTLNWAGTTNGAFCIYDDLLNTPGYLYNWYAVNDTNLLSPDGWHVPTDTDWKNLETYLGMSKSDAEKINWRGTDEGEKLKIRGPQGWKQYSDVWGSDESGFSALAGNCRMFNGNLGTPSGIGYTGFWWTASEGGNNQAWYRYLDYKNKNIFRYYGPKTYGFSIRCVKDKVHSY